MNIANCLSKNAQLFPTRVAVEAPVFNGYKNLTFKELEDLSNRYANGLKKLGVQKGDRVALYLPMVPELAIAMLACARIGAIHSIVFAGFSATALADRVNDAEAQVIITSDG